MSAKPKLSDRRKKFISAYLETLNASEAARKAGYKGRSNTIGQRLLTNVDIKNAISTSLESVIGANKSSLKKRILDELEQEAFAESTIEDINPKGGTTTRLNSNKMKALELLAKYIGLLTERVEITGKDGAAIEIRWPDDSHPAP